MSETNKLESQDSDQATAVVVDVKSGWALSKKQQLLVLALLGILVVAAIVTLFIMNSNQAKDNKIATDAKNNPNSYTAQKAALENKLKKESKGEDKAVTLQDLSALSTQNNDKSAAVTYAQKAVTESGTVNSYAALGYAAEQAGDYKAAIAAYQKAASMSTKTDNPDENNDYNYYSGRATYLSTKVAP